MFSVDQVKLYFFNHWTTKKAIWRQGFKSKNNFYIEPNPSTAVLSKQECSYRKYFNTLWWSAKSRDWRHPLNFWHFHACIFQCFFAACTIRSLAQWVLLFFISRSISFLRTLLNINGELDSNFREGVFSSQILLNYPVIFHLWTGTQNLNHKVCMKATKIDEIFTVDLTLCSKFQNYGEDFVNFCGLLRKHEC